MQMRMVMAEMNHHVFPKRCWYYKGKRGRLFAPVSKCIPGFGDKSVITGLKIIANKIPGTGIYPRFVQSFQFVPILKRTLIAKMDARKFK